MLTNFPSRKVGSLSPYHMAKSRWKIEILLNWLLIFPALVMERLYRIRYLHRGTHPVRSAEGLCRPLWLGLSRPCAHDRS